MRTLVEDFNTQIYEEMDDITSKVMAGVSSYDEYKRLVGRYNGMKTSVDTLAEILKQRLGENDDDEQGHF